MKHPLTRFRPLAFALIVTLTGCGTVDLSERQPFATWIGQSYTLEKDSWLVDRPAMRIDWEDYIIRDWPSGTDDSPPDLEAGTPVRIERVVRRRMLIGGPGFFNFVISLDVPEKGTVRAYHWFTAEDIDREAVAEDHPLARWVGQPVQLDQAMMLWRRPDFMLGGYPWHELTPRGTGRLDRSPAGRIAPGTTVKVVAIEQRRHRRLQTPLYAAVVEVLSPVEEEIVQADIWLVDGTLLWTQQSR